MDTLRWGSQRAGERVLRIWLGGTFTYAGVHKLADPGFLSDGSTTYIGRQLEGFAQGSPIAPVLDLAANAPVLAGVAVAVTEILIGLATLAGVAPAIAATGGVLLSVSLWLSASWQIQPYFLGSDSIYAVAWLAYLLSLPGLAEFLSRIRARRERTLLDAADDDEDPLSAGAPAVADASDLVDVAEPLGEVDAVGSRRRTVMRGGAVVVGGLALGGLAGALGRSRDQPSAAASTRPSGSPTSAASSTPSPTGASVAKFTTVEALGSFDFTTAAGDPAVVIALANGTPAAFSRVCTHSGCTAGYDASSKLIVCPCHGSRFDPAADGAPVRGPATEPLSTIPVAVDPETGDVRLA